MTRIVKMADQKDSTPPPLLLMPASEGLTLSPAGGASLLMPVPQNEASLLAPEEEGEADSFVGQGPSASQPAPFPLFSGPPVQSDPFSQVRQPTIGHPNLGQPSASSTPTSVPFAGNVAPQMSVPPPTSQPPPQPFGAPSGAAPPPQLRGSGSNMYRMAGPPRRAAPPPMAYGQYGMSQSGPSPGGPPGMSMRPPMSSPMVPSTSSGPPASMGLPMSAPGSESYQTRPPMMSTPPITSSYQMGAPQEGMQVHIPYVPVSYHWFFSFRVEFKIFWKPFSKTDSANLEEAFLSGQQSRQVVPVEGGRYDVNILERKRTPVYWDEDESRVMRCSWFYKPDGETRFAPYDEEFAEKLENEYRQVLSSSAWHKVIEFPGGDTMVIHSPQVIVHYSAQPDEFGATQSDQVRPRVVKRGIEEFDGVEAGESPQVDHLVLVVHGIGSTCDIRFRNIVECVDDFRRIGQGIVSSHFNQYQQEGRIGRVEYLPVRWHAALHGDATGVDTKLKAITLNSIGKLRHYTNDTLLDILFYTSPAYCQTIADTVVYECNRLHSLFCQRNPHFRGQVSLVGHSLGSLILFDLLSHQRTPGSAEPEPEAPSGVDLDSSSRSTTPSHEDGSEAGDSITEKEDEPVTTLEQVLQRLSLAEFVDNFKKEQIDLESLMMCEDSDIKEMGIPLGPRKKLQGYLKLYKKRQAKKKEAKSERRSMEKAQQSQSPQTPAQSQPFQNGGQTKCDPILRLASNTTVNYVVGGSGIGIPFVKYPQLNFAPAHFFALGSPIAMFFTVRGGDSLGEEFSLPTCPHVFNIFHPFDPVAYRMEPLITMMCPQKPYLMPHHKGRKRMHLELKESIVRMGADLKAKILDSMKSTWRYVNDFAQAHRAAAVEQEVSEALSKVASQAEEDQLETGSIMSDMPEEDIMLGQLNQGRRVDYVLQEAPFESFNEYLFALGSHGCYWESEDTLLMIEKEIYCLYGMFPRRPGQGPPPPPTVPNLPPPGAATKLHSPPGAFSPQQNSQMPGFNSPYSSAGYNMSSPNVAPPPVSGPVGPPPRMGFVRK